MEPEDPERVKKEKIATIEKELADLRQGLCLVQDYYHDLDAVARRQNAAAAVDSRMVKPLLEDDGEFEGIWKFHDEMLIPDPASSVPAVRMYDAFIAYCTAQGREIADRPSFEFVLSRMGVKQETGRAFWTGCRLRDPRK